MSIIATTRRGFLKGACILSGGLLLGVRMANKAYAAAKDFKDYMSDRSAAVYSADSAFPKRASQDNTQVKALYDSWLGKPLSPGLFHLRDPKTPRARPTADTVCPPCRPV